MGQAHDTGASSRERRISAPSPMDAGLPASPREVPMRAKRVAAVVFGVFLSITSLSRAGDAVDAAVPAAPETAYESTVRLSAEAGAISPWIHRDMSESVRARLEAGFELALRQIEGVPECRALFEELGADALETLSTGLYFPIGSHRKEKAVCGRAMAYTNVGAAPTFLCRDFARLSDERAAMYVIHEALHHAGLTEKPHDPGAMTSRAINSMVTDACRF